MTPRWPGVGQGFAPFRRLDGADLPAQPEIGQGMLVLTLREGERIIIGPVDKPIAVLTLAELKSNAARISIEADRATIPIIREELLARAGKPPTINPSRSI